jgi:hypothetical protein
VPVDTSHPAEEINMNRICVFLRSSGTLWPKSAEAARQLFLFLLTLSACLAAACLPPLAARAADNGPGDKTSPSKHALNKQSVPSLTPIPREAEIIFRSQRGGARSPSGEVNDELWISDAEGKHLTQITHNGYFYAHFDASPDRRYIAAMRITHGDTNYNERIDEMDRKTLWVLDLEAKEEWPLLEDYDSAWAA